LLQNLATSLIMEEQINTSEAKAKELAHYIEPFVTRAREGTVISRRLLARHLPPPAVKKLVDEIAPRYAERPGGYTRITKMPVRKTDASRRAKIEFV